MRVRVCVFVFLFGGRGVGVMPFAGLSVTFPILWPQSGCGVCQLIATERWLSSRSTPAETLVSAYLCSEPAL